MAGTPYPDGRTDLHRAASRGDTEACIGLVEQGAGLDAVVAGGGFTPLLEAVTRQHKGTAAALVALGAVCTPAMRNCHLAGSERELLDHVVALPRLHAAVASGEATLVLRLLEEGADPAKPGPDGQDLAHTARQWGQKPLLEVVRSWSARHAAGQALKDLAEPAIPRPSN